MLVHRECDQCHHRERHDDRFEALDGFPANGAIARKIAPCISESVVQPNA